MRNEPLTPESVQLIIDYMTKKRSHHKPSQQLFRELAELLDRPVHTIANIWHREQRKVDGTSFKSECAKLGRKLKRTYDEDCFDPACDLRHDLTASVSYPMLNRWEQQTPGNYEPQNVCITGHGRTRMMF